MSLPRQFWFRALSVVGLLATSMGIGAMESASTAPFDKALLAQAVPDGRHEADIVVATLRARNRPQMADALDVWLRRRDLERLLGRVVAAGSVDEAIHSPFADRATLNRIARTEFEARFPVDFREDAWPAETGGPVASLPTRLAPGVLQWNDTLAGRVPRRFDTSIKVGNGMNRPVAIDVSWELEGWVFLCASSDIPAAQSAVVTCSTATQITADAHLAGDLVALKAGQAPAGVLSRRVVIPSLDVKLRVSTSGVEPFDDNDHVVKNANMAEARRLVAQAPCESTENCDYRPPTSTEVQGNSYARLAMWVLAFAALLGVRIWRGNGTVRWLLIPWTLYSLAGVAAIVIATIDPPQPGVGDGIVHGAIGQLSLYALSAPWSSIIVTTPGWGPASGLLMLAVLANILYGAVFIFVGDRRLP
jgi:hypothetical protein